MPLITTEKLVRAKEILEKKAMFLVCSVCGSKMIELSPRVFSVPDVPGAKTPVYMDLMFTTCRNCGHVDFFNAHQLEVFRGEEERKC